MAANDKADATTKNTIGDKLIAAALDAFGIDEKYVEASRYDEQTKTAIITTTGGSKVRYKNGDTVTPLDKISVTGINPATKRKPITGAAKK